MKNEDLAHIWHPCTRMKDHESIPLLKIAKAKGVYLYSADGKKYIDCISSWWVNIFGHANEYINEALCKQANTLEHVLLAGCTHPEIIRFSQRLCALQNPKLNKCFYADNGSSGVEVALKMAFHHELLKGKEKPLFLSLNNSYHGETLGALGVCGLGDFKHTYTPLMMDCLHTSVPLTLDFDKELSELECTLKAHGERISAFIIEPLIQCAAGMRMYPAAFINAACKLVKEYGISVIFDEIAVGFGRSGSMFAYEQTSVIPDYLCLSKGITGGYLPLSVVLTSDEVYDDFYHEKDRQKAFLHSHSYTGSALAIACANATLDLFEQGDIINQNKLLSSFIWQRFEEIKKHSLVENCRFKGMIFAFDLKKKRPNIAKEFYIQALKCGLLLRPLGNTIYFMPPYVITKSEVDLVVSGILEVLDLLG